MQERKIGLLILLVLFTTSLAYSQSERLKVVVNNLAFYKQKNDLRFLSNAKKSADSLIISRSDSADLEKNIYRLIVYASILNTDTLNKLNQSKDFADKSADLRDKLAARQKIFNFQPEMDYATRCLANTFIRKGFIYINDNDFANAAVAFQRAKGYSPGFKPVNVYLAYANNKKGNLQEAATYYTNLINTDSTKVEYIETASSIYKAIGDTSKALQILKKGKRLLPNEKVLLQDEANIYNNNKDYRSLEPLLIPLIENNSTNPDITFVAANCYDRLNQFDKAESMYLRTIELNGSAYEPVFNLGLLYFKKSAGKYNKDDKNITNAVLWLEKANELAPGNQNCLAALQLAYKITGDQTGMKE